MQAFERHFLAANRWALIALLAAMSVIIFVNVALRYLTSHSLEWAEEVARHMMIWLTFLGAGPVLRYGGHIAVENLQDALPARGGIALLESQGMKVTRTVDGAAFREALKPAYVGYAKEFGADNIKKITDVK